MEMTSIFVKTIGPQIIKKIFDNTLNELKKIIPSNEIEELYQDACRKAIKNHEKYIKESHAKSLLYNPETYGDKKIIKNIEEIINKYNIPTKEQLKTILEKYWISKKEKLQKYFGEEANIYIEPEDDILIILGETAEELYNNICQKEDLKNIFFVNEIRKIEKIIKQLDIDKPDKKIFETNYNNWRINKQNSLHYKKENNDINIHSTVKDYWENFVNLKYWNKYIQDKIREYIKYANLIKIDYFIELKNNLYGIDYNISFESIINELSKIISVANINKAELIESREIKNLSDPNKSRRKYDTEEEDKVKNPGSESPALVTPIRGYIALPPEGARTVVPTICIKITLIA
ncbi:MAG: hypothetical protein AB1461_09235, partial [Thermodesulfobacteriota bacterium]